MEGVKIHHLENRTYFFSINVVSFVKTLQKVEPSCQTSTLITNAAKLSETYMSAVDLRNEGLFKEKIKECRYYVSTIADELSKIQCNEKLLHEKIDLQIENQQFLSIFDNYLQTKKETVSQ